MPDGSGQCYGQNIQLFVETILRQQVLQFPQQLQEHGVFHQLPLSCVQPNTNSLGNSGVYTAKEGSFSPVSHYERHLPQLTEALCLATSKTSVLIKKMI